MRKSFLAGGIAALSLSLVGGAVFAQQGPDRRARADADGDGRISQAEFVQQRAERLARLDSDRDGSVDSAEAASAMAAHRGERMTARFDRLDADRDGSVSRSEFEAAQQARVGRHGGRAGRMQQRMERRGPVSIEQAQARAAETFARLDADRDGYLTMQERRAGREQMREQRRARRGDRSSQAAPAAE